MSELVKIVQGFLDTTAKTIQNPLLVFGGLVTVVTYAYLNSGNRNVALSLAAGLLVVLLGLLYAKRSKYQHKTWRGEPFSPIEIDEFLWGNFIWVMMKPLNGTMTALIAKCPACKIEALYYEKGKKLRTRIKCPKCHKTRKFSGNQQSLLEEVTNAYNGVS